MNSIFDNLMVSAPAKGSSVSAKWWPDLYLKKGRKLQLITPEQCGVVRELYNVVHWDDLIRKDIPLFDKKGTRIGYVSYNGRIWVNEGDGKLEVPCAGRKTAAERELEGWGAK